MNAENKMNQLGRERSPFLFVIPFNKEEVAFVDELKNISQDEILFDFQKNKNTLKSTTFNIIKEFKYISYPSFESYKKGFDKILFHINRGDTFLVNYTKPSEIEFVGSLKDLFYSSSAKYKLFFKDKFVSFSPESFIQIKNNKILSFPMKGTIDLNIPNAEKIILNDKKESAEHATIVDLIRNDLSMISKNVKVKKYRFPSKINTVGGNILQISSEITGDLDDNWHNYIGNIIFSTLPAGSISGAPKNKTLKIIEEAEKYKRGFYTGIAGIYDGKSIDSCVLIRFVEKQNNTYIYKAGGGITNLSNPLNEYNELKKKVYVPVK